MKNNYPTWIVHHSPNGGYRKGSEGFFLQKGGVRAGFPDLIFLGRGGKVFFVELKTESKTSRLNDNQKELIHDMHEKGFEVFIIRNIEDFEKLTAKMCIDRWR